jgi:2-C-methyl-D-erythritol 2,4-cyclodiphosphate synthase
MRETLADILHAELDKISIKATTEEHLGFTGRLEGIKCCSVCLLEQNGGNS